MKEEKGDGSCSDLISCGADEFSHTANTIFIFQDKQTDMRLSSSWLRSGCGDSFSCRRAVTTHCGLFDFVFGFWFDCLHYLVAE